MQNSKVWVLFLAGMMALGLTACGENRIPEMSDTDFEAVGEYAAITLMKYDAGHRSRLVDLSLIKDDTEDIEEIKDNTEQEPSGMEPVDDAPVINKETESSGNIVAAPEEVLDLPETISLVYEGQEVCEKYPDTDEKEYFIITPDAGKKLLVLKFSLKNTSDEDVTADILGEECKYKITVNGSGYQTLITMLDNDLSTFSEQIPAGESREVVLLAQIEESIEEPVASELTLKSESKTYTISLQ